MQQGFVSETKRDDLRAAQAQSRARLDELTAQLRVAQLPARVDERAAAAADVDAARQSLQQSAWREAQKSRRAPVAALVADTFFSVGEVLPLTHFLRAVRAIMLKGAGLAEITASLWTMALFLLVVGAIALKRYRQPLD